ncbi:hypothetical protein [Microbacterium foliorum]|uniref:hypothetical protein n=1 Tax=Microbacterium foliorum TaxID=104336 RepID=UPI0015E48B48|nr:hypothetical protein [Microbacterium foliorum]
MNKSLTRSIGFWLLLVLSLASAGIGGWLIAGQIGTMTSTLLDGTATGIEVYVGQSLVVVGAALLGAGVIGILVAVALSAVQAILPSPAPSSSSRSTGTPNQTPSTTTRPRRSRTTRPTCRSPRMTRLRTAAAGRPRRPRRSASSR